MYYAQAIPNCDVYNVLQLKIRTAADTWFVGSEKTYKAYLFNDSDYGVTVFHDRELALQVVKEAEKHRRKITKDDISEDIKKLLENK